MPIINIGGGAWNTKPKLPNEELIVADTGWKTTEVGRCYHKSVREVMFDMKATDEQIKEFADAVKKTMYGQVSVVTIQGLTVDFIHAVDSGD